MSRGKVDTTSLDDPTRQGACLAAVSFDLKPSGDDQRTRMPDTVGNRATPSPAQPWRLSKPHAAQGGVASMKCPGPDSNRHDAFRHRWILSPLCLPVSPPGQRDHCNGGAWIRAAMRSNRIGGNDLSAPLCGRRYEIRGGLAPRSAGAWRQLLPNLGTLVSSAGALHRLCICADARLIVPNG